MDSETVAVRLEKELNQRLVTLATKTGRSKSFYVKQALSRYLEDMEDTYLAIDRIENPGVRVSMEEAKRILDVED
ncbi:TraY domain-containing protein [Pleurocapsales cyanobacterium LEGE 10410]|nr:TraY domain-containing protein [Pleurocapsales cyanobacterium LEGE 10410]